MNLSPQMPTSHNLWRTLASALDNPIPALAPLGGAYPIADGLPTVIREGKALRDYFLEVEASFRPSVDAALSRFIQTAGWPKRMSAPARFFIVRRLAWGRDISIALSIPITTGKTPSWLLAPEDITDEKIKHWLLFSLWDAQGRDALVAELSALHQSP